MESVSRICLIELAFDLCADWKKLGYAFCLSNEVDRISQDYRKNVFEQAYRILLAWKQKNGSKATYQALGEALRRRTLTRTDLAEKYCEGGYQGSLKTDICLQGQLKTGKVSESDVVAMANDLGKEWMWVGRLLGLEDTTLDDIKESHDKLYECSYEMLLSWTQKNSAQATYHWLAQALLHRAVGMREIAEMYCIEHLKSQSASYVRPEEIQSLNTKMEQLQVHLPKESVVAVASNSTENAEVKIVNKSRMESGAENKTGAGLSGTSNPLPVPDDCIRKNFITVLRYKVWKELIIKLDPPRELQMRGDYKDLAAEMGYDVEKILYFQSLRNPTEALLTNCSVTVEELCNKLEAIGRSDARLVIDEWVKSQDCKCTACHS